MTSRPALRWQVLRLVGRLLLGVEHLQLVRLLMQRRDLLGGAARTMGVVALGGLGAAGRVAAAPLPESLVAAGSDHAMAVAGSAPGGGPDRRGALQDCTPRDALERLQEGNARFAAAWQQASGLASPQERMGQMQTVWQQGCQIDPLALAEGQRPFAALLSCADSRVDPAWLFACGAGELYEVRSAGNTAFREAIGSLEFAVGVLGVPLLLVLGHSGCGAVKAARGTAALSPLLEELVVPIRAHLVSGDDLTRAVQRNIGAAAEGLRAGSALIREAVAAGQLSIRSAYFEIGSGVVTLL